MRTRTLRITLLTASISVPAFADNTTVTGPLGDGDSVTELEAVTTDSQSGCNCFRGRPLPKCGSFWITELGLSYKLNASSRNSEEATTRFSADVGYMKNVNPRDGWGGTVFLSSDANQQHVGLRLRYRRWLNAKSSLDVSPGLLLAGGRRDRITCPPGIPALSLRHRTRSGTGFR